jgi:predicted metalloprotease
MRRTTVCAIAAVLLVGAGGCASGVSGTPAVGTAAVAATTSSAVTTPPSTPTSTAPDTTIASDVSVPVTSGTGTDDTAASTDGTLASGVTIDELADDLEGAQKVVDGFWAKHWTDYYTGEYKPPTVVGLYDGTDPKDTPTCDGEPLESFNAFYCVSEDYVAWDASLLVNGADLIGDSWVYLVVAHEWGHAIQARLEDDLVATAQELQADCLGAAAMYGAVADGTLELEPGDDQELIGSLTTLADEMPWTMAADHGDPFQRVEWFTKGRNGGVPACFEPA